jgi:hypothetical protein
MNTTFEGRQVSRTRSTRRQSERRRSDERAKTTDFLEALYIPQQLRVAPEILSSPRCKVGNRSNLLTVALERAEARARSLKWAKLLFLHERKEEPWTGFLRSVAAVSGLLVAALFIGLGVRGEPGPQKDRTASPTAFSVAPPMRHPSTAIGPRRPTPAEQTKVLQNDLGQVVEVRASDPGAVLVNFCSTMVVMACDPVELAWSAPPNPHLRLGLYHSDFTMRAIQIRRVPGSREWVAGDGQQAIASFPAGSLRLSEDRLPLPHLP